MSKVKMFINVIWFSIVKTSLPASSLPYTGRRKKVLTITYEMMLDNIAAKKTGLGKDDIQSIGNLFYNEILEQLRLGNNVIMPFGEFSTSITGGFTSPEDGFDPSRNHVNLKVNAPEGMQKYLRSHVSVEKVTAPLDAPIPQLFTDGVSHSHTNTNVGQTVTLSGKKLLINEANGLEGIYFVNTVGPEVWKVADIIENTPSKLIFKVPNIVAFGPYKIEIRIVRTLANEVRVGTLSQFVFVSPALIP